MKRFLALLVLLSVLLSLCACGDPPVQTLQTDKSAEYLRLNTYVSDILAADFAGSLPEAIPQNTDCDYRHYYQCAVLGDPHFAVYLSVTVSGDVFRDELTRIENLNAAQQTTDGPVLCFVFQGTDKEVSEYLDTSEIYDGRSFRFEMVKFDTDSNTIEYLTALQNDNAVTELVRDFLSVQ